MFLGQGRFSSSFEGYSGACSGNAGLGVLSRQRLVGLRESGCYIASQERAVMDKGVTGLDRAQLSRLVELAVQDEEIALAPRILGPLGAVRATLIYSGHEIRYRL